MRGRAFGTFGAINRYQQFLEGKSHRAPPIRVEFCTMDAPARGAPNPDQIFCKRTQDDRAQLRVSERVAGFAI
jgi:hypothetical protein